MVPVHITVSFVFVVLAGWVLVARPGKTLNRSMAALLILYAGSGLIFQVARESLAGSPEHIMMSRVGSIYEFPEAFLGLLIADCLFLRQPRPRWRTNLLAAVAGITIALLVLYFARPPEVDWLRSPWYGPLGPNVWNSAGAYLVWGVVLVMAGRFAASPAHPIFERRRAAAVGIAFGLLLLHTSGLFVGALLSRGFTYPYEPAGVVLDIPRTLGVFALVYAFVRIPAPFTGWTRHAARWVLLVPLTAGIIDVYVTGGSALALLGITATGLGNTRFIWWGAFAVLLAVAILRYDLGGTTPAAREHTTKIAGGFLGLSVAALILGTSLSVFGIGRTGVLTGTLAAVPVVALFATGVGPLHNMAARVTSRILLDPQDPEVLRERVRIYKGALAAAQDPTGQVRPAAEDELRVMRNRLGLSQRDHDLLVALDDSHTSADRLVAYRLALEEGLHDQTGVLDEAERRVREGLGLSPREQQIIASDVFHRDPTLEEGALVASRYRLVRRLGRGGFAEVWLAHDHHMKRDVALKRLLPEEARDERALRVMQREAENAGALSHPNIVAVHDIATSQRAAYLVMEYLPGGSLQDRLREHGPLSEQEAIHLGTDVLLALGALHEQGIIHRDIKPGNILLDGNGRAKLGDFTVARAIVSGDTIGGDGTRGPVGTFGYMAPEQARGLAPRPQADQYGLAATLREGVTGSPYLKLHGLSHEEAIAKIVQAPPPSPAPGVSKSFNAVVQKALATRAVDRYPDANAMRIALLAITASKATTPPGKQAGSSPRPTRRPD